MPGILDYIQGLGARITSTKRDPNSPLGRANPRSYHNIGQAVDIAPIPGMTFDQYVAGLKSAGFPIIEALDEAKHPLKHTTGPNWHIAYGKGQPMLGQSPFPYQPGQDDPLAPMSEQQPMPLPNWQHPGPEIKPSVLSQSSISDLMQLDPASLTQNMPNVEGKGPGFFGKGGAGWTILGYLGDAIAQHYGGQPVFGRMQAEQRQDERRREEYAQSRRDRLAEAGEILKRQIALKQWEQSHPDPAQPSSAARMAYEIGLKPGTPEFRQFIRQYAQRPIMIGGQPWGYDDGSSNERTVTRTGTDASGRKVVQYSDGSIDYAD